MIRQHHYRIVTAWTGNQGTGTSGYRDYNRNHVITVENKADILGSSDPAFHGDHTRYNPEELLVSSLSGCHMLWYLHLCAEAGVVVTDYVDHATGTMEETVDGGGRFIEVTLHPMVTVTDASMVEKAEALHREAGRYCFIARSVNFPIAHEATIQLTSSRHL
jgi:organic hydroperoxide reductase OsmC/OhrA